MSGPSAVTQRLIDQLIARDAHGKAKYGTSLDRGDLSIEEWLQHAIEESLDRAGYMEAAKREVALLRSELAPLAIFRETLQLIVAADYTEWDELANPEEFVTWAKSRATFALAKHDALAPPRVADAVTP